MYELLKFRDAKTKCETRLEPLITRQSQAVVFDDSAGLTTRTEAMRMYVLSISKKTVESRT
jgi:hypothetical protein